MRINARLDDSYAEKLAFLQEATDLSLSDIVRDAVDRYYRDVLAEQSGRQASLDRLVGAFSGGPADGAVTYKTALVECVAAKHAARASVP